MNDKFVSGHIPDKIKYVYLAKINYNVGTYWDSNKEIEGYPTCIVDATKSSSFNNASKKIINIAKHNNKNNNYYHALYDECDNTLITDVKVISCDQTYSGNLNYKALINKKYIVDLPSDLILDTALKTGIKKNGILKGKFLWAQIGRSVRLVRENSELHNLLLEFQTRKTLKQIPNKDLKAGGIYQDKRKNKYIFLGTANSTLLKKEIKFYDPKYIADFKYDKKKIKNNLLFLYIFNKPVKKFADISDKLTSTVLVNNHKMIEMVGEIKVPKKIISIIRDVAKKEMKKVILNLSDKSSSRIIDKTSNFLEYKVADLSPLLHLHEEGEQPPELFDVKQHLYFI